VVPDPLHHVTVNERATVAVYGQAAPSGNLLSVTNAKSEKMKYTYNCDGTLATQKDARDALTTYAYSGEGALTHTYDVAGNRKIVQSDSGAYDVTYTHDELNRLHSVTDNIAGGGTSTYHFDNVGRLTPYDYPNTISRSRTSSVSGIPNQNSTYDNNDRLLSDGWDADGNMVSSNGNEYAYDSESRLVSLNSSQVRYTYDGDGRLVQKTVGSSTTSF